MIIPQKIVLILWIIITLEEEYYKQDLYIQEVLVLMIMKIKMKYK